MWKFVIQIKMKQDVHFKNIGEYTSYLVRKMIDVNGGELKEEHKQNMFRFYSFSQPFPREDEGVYKQGSFYQVEIKTLDKRFINFKKLQDIETDEMKLANINGTKLVYKAKGSLYSKTPCLIDGKKIKTKVDEKNFQDRLENGVIEKVLKAENINKNEFESYKGNIFKDIVVFKDQPIGIKYLKKSTETNTIFHRCYNLQLYFQDNEMAQKAEQILYVAGIGRETSLGLGYAE